MVDWKQFWISNYDARINLFDAPMEIGISVMCRFSRMGGFIPGSDKKTTISAPPDVLDLEIIKYLGRRRLYHDTMLGY